MGISESKITCAFDGQEAIKAVKANIWEHQNDPTKELFSVIISDYNVPKGTATEILLMT
jgi:CheY-like chemotaxis protein